MSTLYFTHKNIKEMDKRLIIVSNRLPVTIDEISNTETRNIGGLATGLSSFVNKIDNNETEFKDYMWFGWPGKFVDQAYRNKLSKEYLVKHKYQPVYLAEETVKGYYEEYSNTRIWPLFHGFSEKVESHKNSWESYCKANQDFYDALKVNLQEGDFVWIHDYHLMLLPQMIRNDFEDITISFFLHIPFPDFGMFQILSKDERFSLLEGISGANVIGFHCFSYLKNFSEALSKSLGLTHENYMFRKGRQQFKLDVFPMGVDFEGIREVVNSEYCNDLRKTFSKNIQDCKLIISIDRLDYTKGIVNRLIAYNDFLMEYPSWRRRVILKLIVAPSRRNLESYCRLKLKIDELVGRINGKFSTYDWTPIIYHYNQYNLAELCALYSLADVALITPLKDGMNLIAKEFIAANEPEKGVLVLSEAAGAACELIDSIIVNSHSIEEIKEAINRALNMSELEKFLNNERMTHRIKSYSVHDWVIDIIQVTKETKELPLNTKVKRVDDNIRNTMLESLKKSKSALFILDYDGTLSNIDKNNLDPKPDPRLLNDLVRIQELNNTKVVILSGRDKRFLTEYFSGLNITLMADMGAWVLKDKEWEILNPIDEEWKTEAEKLIEKYVKRLPNSLMESKENLVVWDYRMAEKTLKDHRIAELLNEVESNDILKGTAHNMVGQNTLLFKNRNGGKGPATKYLLEQESYDFIFTAGDDDADEEMFAVLPEESFSVKVGSYDSKARYMCDDHTSFLGLLEDFSLVDNCFKKIIVI